MTRAGNKKRIETLEHDLIWAKRDLASAQASVSRCQEQILMRSNRIWSLTAKLDEANKKIGDLKAQPAIFGYDPAISYGAAHSYPYPKVSLATGGLVKTHNETKLETLLEDILTLEPQLKHHLVKRPAGTVGGYIGVQTDWDYTRVHRAAEHIRNQEAAASVGYTEDCVCDPQPAQRGLYIVDPEPAA